MDEQIINLILEQIKEAEELGQKEVHVDSYQELLNYHVVCLEVLYDDIFRANQQLRELT
ncbi:hypothetical protein [Enterococcus plantarum]|uniref:hypothetical protein n=1 Tax=Enterococcus plantarum TaxID=1077675 RepID=UPI001A90920A|nr:hypothetical protein [Enterococcus plantarum]MBO0422293.1 hypothetical protein [Enterococcus plantarum]